MTKTARTSAIAPRQEWPAVSEPLEIFMRTRCKHLAGAALLLIGLASHHAAAQATTAPTTAPAPVVAIASVEAFWSADQYAKTSGYVTDVKADIGDRVKKGQ